MEPRQCIVFWAYQDFRSEDRAMTDMEIDALVAEDPLVMTVAARTGDDGGVEVVFQRSGTYMENLARAATPPAPAPASQAD